MLQKFKSNLRKQTKKKAQNIQISIKKQSFNEKQREREKERKVSDRSKKIQKKSSKSQSRKGSEEHWD